MIKKNNKNLILNFSPIMSWNFRPGEISCEVTESEINDTNHLKPYVLYTLSLSGSGHKWHVKRRYNDFVIFHEKMMNTSCSKKKLSKLPPKIIFGNLKEENISKRKAQLDDYIQEIFRNESDLMVDNETKSIFYDFFIKDSIED